MTSQSLVLFAALHLCQTYGQNNAFDKVSGIVHVLVPQWKQNSSNLVVQSSSCSCLVGENIDHKLYNGI